MTICSCGHCGKYYDPATYPIYLPNNPKQLCVSCLEKDLTVAIGEELVYEFDRMDRERINDEENKIDNRFEILDL